MRGRADVGEEVGVSGGHQRVEAEEAGVAMVGMESVSPPRVVSEHHGRTERTDDTGHLSPLLLSVAEFAVHPAQEQHPVVGGRA
jgi:hypothetical protein